MSDEIEILESNIKPQPQKEPETYWLDGKAVKSIVIIVPWFIAAPTTTALMWGFVDSELTALTATYTATGFVSVMLLAGGLLGIDAAKEPVKEQAEKLLSWCFGKPRHKGVNYDALPVALGDGPAVELMNLNSAAASSSSGFGTFSNEPSGSAKNSFRK